MKKVASLSPTTTSTAKQELKQAVHDYWNAQSCGTDVVKATKFSFEYFEAVEDFRYVTEPQIHSFAQFSRFHGKKVLEIGVGAGTDFLQWVRSGAQAYGVDLTEEGVEHAKRRLELYGLEAKEVRVADAENLPFPEESFDLVYSWGVIHHSPNTEKALEEIIRVLRVGGRMKIMIYNRHSLHTFYRWIRYALLRGKPFRSFAWVLYHHMESSGTKGYSIAEIQSMLNRYQLRTVSISAIVNRYDLLQTHVWPLQKLGRLLATICGYERAGFFLTFEAEKAVESRPSKAAHPILDVDQNR
jgi:ubiquinone/menaquinone biosynthesis C-methylase UbiE